VIYVDIKKKLNIKFKVSVEKEPFIQARIFYRARMMPTRNRASEATIIGPKMKINT